MRPAIREHVPLVLHQRRLGRYSFVLVQRPNNRRMGCDRTRGSNNRQRDQHPRFHCFSSIGHRICIRSMQPSIARVVCIVPAQTASTTAFVRVRVGNAGATDHHWFRYDAIMDVVSWRVPPRSGVFNDRYRAGNSCQPRPSSITITIHALVGRSGIRCVSTASSTLVVTVHGIAGFIRATLNVPAGSQGVEQDLPPGFYYVRMSTADGMSLGSRNLVIQ